MDPEDQADAIQQDVSTELQTLTSDDSPRMRAMEAIDAKMRASRDEELAGGEGSNDTQLEAQLSEPEPEPEPAAKPESHAHRVKIDGVEQEVDTETLIRAYQKNAAADRRLEEAAQLLRNAQQIAAQTAAQLGTAPVEPEQSVDIKAQAAGLVETLMTGDTDTATEALVKLLTQSRGGDQPTPQAPAVDPDVLTSQVLERIAVNSAFERIQSDYPEIISDPDLEALAISKRDRLMANGKTMAEAMVEASDEVYRIVGKTPNGRQAAPAEQKTSVRKENKARLDPIPAASAVAVSPKSPAESSPSALIAEMASKRLGQSLPQ